MRPPIDLCLLKKKAQELSLGKALSFAEPQFLHL